MVDIVVVGYPKSGNTWVTRLVAELVGCPVVGFFGSEHNEIAREGLDRQTYNQCFKSHHQFNEILDIGVNAKKIIYVVRDPRDVCLSGSRYFKFDRLPFLSKCMGILPMGGRIYRKINNHLLTPSGYRIKQIMNCVIFGSRKVHWWVRIPWKDHYKPYLDNQCFFVKYEDLLDHSVKECRRIISYLGIERDEQQIKEAIDRQSFKKKKEYFIGIGEIKKANFMKVGRKEQWRESIKKKQKGFFNRMLADDLARFNYPLF